MKSVAQRTSQPRTGSRGGRRTTTRVRQAHSAMTAAELQKAIELAGHSQFSAARELGISRRMLMYYLSGEHEIPRLVELAVRSLRRPRKAHRR